MKLNFFFLPPLLAVSLIFTEPCEPARQQSGAPSINSAQPPVEVSVVYPRFEEVTRNLAVTGKFLASDRLLIKAEYRGSVEKVFAGEGDRVNVGDPLYNYRSEELLSEIAKKQAEIREAEATLDYDQRTLAQPSALAPHEEAKDTTLFPDEAPPSIPVPPKVQEPIAPPQPVEPSRSPGDMPSKIRVDEAKLDLLQKEFEQLENRRQKLNAISPIQGIIQKKSITEGSVVEAGDALFEIVNLNPITFSVNVPQEFASFVDRQTPVKVSLADSAQAPADGIVYFLSPSIDPVTKTMEVRVHVPNDNFAIKEGQTGLAQISTKRVEKALVLPNQALAKEGDKNYIYVVTGNLAQKIEVKLGQPMGADEVEIIADLRVDDPVVIRGQVNLKNKSPVNVIKEIPAQQPPPAGALP